MAIASSLVLEEMTEGRTQDINLLYDDQIIKQCIISFLCFLASLYGGVSMPLTEDHIWTVLPQMVWLSGSGSLSHSGFTASKPSSRLIFITASVLIVNTFREGTALFSEHHIIIGKKERKKHLSTVCAYRFSEVLLLRKSISVYM